MTMKIRVDTAPSFDKQFKRLSRKFPLVVEELDHLITHLESGEQPGDKISGVGHDVYKVRLKNPSAGRGKRGGFRVIYYVQIAEHIILLTLYSKSEQDDISPQEIRRVIEILDDDLSSNE
jgi:mRNA-degrading endonuclease RelE of RelBE toxin-antitoxin system